MTTTTQDPPTVAVDQAPISVRETIARALAERDEGMAAADAADVTGWDKAVIDQAIDAWAALGEPFSANDFRELLGDVRTSLMGSRFHAAASQGRIRRCGRVPSTKRNTHGKPIDTWIGTNDEEPHS